MMLASAPAPDGNSFLNWWLALGLVVSVLGNIATPIIILVINARKQKREVSFTFEPASKQEFDKHVQDTKDGFDRIDRQRAEGAHRVDDLTQRI